VSPFAVTVLPQAEAEMRDAFLWYFERNVLIADGFGSEVADAVDGLEITAPDWPKDEEGVHFYHLKHFPYTVWYEIEGAQVTVLAVAHQRREPRYWDRR
jgi:plasmid stabilization system protein ParE